MFFRLFDPPAKPDFLICPFLVTTGLPCPLCGMTRGLCAAAKGEWLEAMSFHALSPLALAAFAGWLGVSALGLMGYPYRRSLPWRAVLLMLLSYGGVRLLVHTL
jgi:hypothetical protein